MAREYPREGEDGLSGKKSDEARRATSSDGKKGTSKKAAQSPDPVGRALRSVYDDTLREEIPDEFKDLLGKLS
ncbi:NepR family anti-sigma factor [Sphingomicrobium lutaoense]|uniref:Anti-sigma factor NepR domain-containing protein n=1 Tax=Sphingomicrobium lutaoense TaxID=515949 RepID=A0A839Z423_9SPHN|nr:NepR family anti-sigma factor [Sphingomicrobium lutaoense]MBB3764335.1 hypothetical protein [Sphingomicrobium lutaoense]